jgi:hypothetical protein
MSVQLIPSAEAVSENTNIAIAETAWALVSFAAGHNPTTAMFEFPSRV